MAKFQLYGNDTHRTKLNSQGNEEHLIFKGCLPQFIYEYVCHAGT